MVLLIYLCTRCCDTKSTKHRKSRPIRCILSFFALVTAAALAGGFWGNQVLHQGMNEFEMSAENINNIVRRVQVNYLGSAKFHDFFHEYYYL